MADVKVLMLGGRRCGKSSILSSMVGELTTNLILKQCVNIENTGKGETNGVSLEQKHNRLLSFMDKEQHPRGSYYLVDFHADQYFSSYIFKVRIPGKRGSMSIEFVDAPGESYENMSDHHERVCKEMNDTDVYVIVVDTPYLMESDQGKFQSVNCVMEICNMFDSYAPFDPTWKRKKVIFVPVKCEKWKDQLNIVTEKLKVAYKSLLDRLQNESRFSYSVLPVLTAGGIRFGEFGAPELLHTVEMGQNEYIKCSHLGSGKHITQVRTEDGDNYFLEEEDKVLKNAEYTDVSPAFPYYSWFKSVGDFSPMHCDQLALHILRFLIYRFKIDVNHHLLPAFLTGDLRIKDMEQLLQTLAAKQLIKDEGDGISHMRKLE